MQAKAKELGSRKGSTPDDDSTFQAKKKRDEKRCHTEPESEVEVVDEDVEPPEKIVEDVEDSIGGQKPSNEQGVSTSHISWTLETHHTLG